MTTILIFSHLFCLALGSALTLIGMRALRSVAVVVEAPPSGFDSDPMMESDDEAASASEFKKRLAQAIAADLTSLAMRTAKRAKSLPNPGYPLTHEETEAMLAECPQPFVLADIGLCKIPKGTFPERAEPRYDERCGCEPVPEDCKAFGINSPKTDTGD